MPHLSRTSWLRSALTAVAVPLVARRRAAAQGAPVRIGASSNESSGGVFYASDLGLFERAGLATEILILQNGAAIGAAIAGGSLDIGTSSAFVFMNARRHGLPYTLIAPGTLYESNNAASLLVVPANSPIHSARDLNGKTIGGIGVGALDNLAIVSWIDQNGGDSTTVKVLETSPSTMVDAMEQGRIAAAVLGEPQLSAAGNRIRTLGKAYDAIAKTFMLSVWFTTIEWATKNPGTAKRFTNALEQAATWSAANPERAAVSLEKWTKIKIPRVRTRSAPRLEAGLIQPICDLALKYKMIDKPMDAREFIWNGRA
jgi:NitT/TauT family transport system substrate-binding protein